MRLDVPRRPAGGDEFDRQRHGGDARADSSARAGCTAALAGTPIYASATAWHASWRRRSRPATAASAASAIGLGRERNVLARSHERAEGPDGDATWRAGFAQLAPLVTAWPTSPQLKSGSQLTRRWREMDSSPRSLSQRVAFSGSHHAEFVDDYPSSFQIGEHSIRLQRIT